MQNNSKRHSPYFIHFTISIIMGTVGSSCGGHIEDGTAANSKIRPLETQIPSQDWGSLNRDDSSASLEQFRNHLEESSSQARNGDHRKAESALQKATQLADREFKDTQHHNFISIVLLIAEGDLHLSQGNYLAAEESYEDILAQLRRHPQEAVDPQLPDWSSTVINNLGLAYKGQGKYSQAKAQLEQALAHANYALAAQNDPAIKSSFVKLINTIQDNLSDVCRQLGQ